MLNFLLAVCIVWGVLWLGLTAYCWKNSDYSKPPSFDTIMGLGFICLLLTIIITLLFLILFVELNIYLRLMFYRFELFLIITTLWLGFLSYLDKKLESPHILLNFVEIISFICLIYIIVGNFIYPFLL